MVYNYKKEVIFLRINEVSIKTGLTKKAVRFYEKKGLLNVERISNGYREYNEDDIELLKNIKSLRMAGISVSDIKLLFDGIVTIEELSLKRQKEIENEFGLYSSQLENCNRVIYQYKNKEFDNLNEHDEADELDETQLGELAVGIDIGTTSISAVVLDITNKSVVEFYTIPNNYYIKNENSAFFQQDAELICKKALELADHITSNYNNIKSIGVTGQMHGILYIDKKGNSVSPLITWQDKRGDLKISNSLTYCEKIKELTDEKISTGYGFATHFYNTKNGLVPQNAYSMCSIMDYLVMKLTGNAMPVMHNSVAASFGLFDIENNTFKNDKIEVLGIDNLKLPGVCDDFLICGKYKNISVSVAIGDNQASFLGTVKDIDATVLVNIGTGSQISYVSEAYDIGEALEIRPLVKNKYIVCGSALCAGSAYALCENFFREYMKAATGTNECQYDVINRLAQQAIEEKKEPLEVNTAFSGKRNAPLACGSIDAITTQNFTPSQMVLGFIYGICRELYDFMGDSINDKSLIVASGNAVQKIPVMKNVLFDVFGVEVQISKSREEASLGTALFSGIANGDLKDITETSGFINYK